MLPFIVQLPIRVALIEIIGVTVREDDDAGYRELVRRAEAIRASHPDDASPGDIPGVQVARSLFRMLGIDPTRHRPSSEKLLQRVLKGKPLPKVNTLVDVGNWCSLDFLLPLGVYDRAKITGGVTLRKGLPGETYRAIGETEMNLAERYTLADDDGPFGSPITDSLRTSVTTACTETALFLYAPMDYDVEKLKQFAQMLAERVIDICGGELDTLIIVDGEAMTTA